MNVVTLNDRGKLVDTVFLTLGVGEGFSISRGGGLPY